MTERERLLAAYDDQLRTDAETPGALAVTRHSPLRLVTFPGRRGFVTYRDLDGADAAGVRDLVAAAVDHYRALDVADAVDRFEWKSRGHDHAPGLHEALLEHGFEAEEPESIMMGDARGSPSTSTSPTASRSAGSPRSPTSARWSPCRTRSSTTRTPARPTPS